MDHPRHLTVRPMRSHEQPEGHVLLESEAHRYHDYQPEGSKQETVGSGGRQAALTISSRAVGS